MKKNQIFIVAILVGLLLLLVNYFAGKKFVRVDLTRDKVYTLSESTQKILSGLDDRVTIKLYFTKKIPVHLKPVVDQIIDLINEYKVYSNGKIIIDRIAPEESPQKEQEAKMLGIPPLQLNVVEKDKQEVQKVFLGAGLFYGDKKVAIPLLANLPSIEYDLTAAILKLTAKKVPVMGLVLPNPSDLTQNPYQLLEKVLSDQVNVKKFGYDEKDFKNIDALLVIEPREVTPAFSAQLDGLLDEGVPVVVLASRFKVAPDLSATSVQTGLEDWLKDKGITLSDNAIIDTKNPGRAAFSSGFVQYNIPYPFFVQVKKDGFNSKNSMTSKLELVTFPWPSAITFDSTKNNWTSETLAESSAVSFIPDGPPQFSPQVLDGMTPLPGSKKAMAVLLTQKSKSGKEAKIIVVSNVHFVQNNFIQNNDSNAFLLQNMVDWMSWGDSLIGIRSRGQTDNPIAMPSSAIIAAIRWGHLIGIPLLLVGCVFGYHYLRAKKFLELRRKFD